MNQTSKNLTDRGGRGHSPGIGVVLAFMVLAACSSGPKEQQPRTLSDLLGQSAQEYSGRPTKTDLTPDSMVRMGAQLEAQGDYSGAMRFYTQAAQMEPNNVAALSGIGNVYLTAGVWAAGLNAFQRVRALDPRSPVSAAGLAVALLLNDRPGEARQLLITQMAMTGAALDLFNLLGLAEDLLGSHGAAQNAYSAALELNPGDGEVLTNLALSYALSGSYVRAEAILRRGARTADAIPLAGQNLALVHALSGDLAKAIEAAAGELSDTEVAANKSFYERLPTLSAGDRARAVFFGTLAPASETLVGPTPGRPAPSVTPAVETPEPEPQIETQPLAQEPPEPPPLRKPEIEEEPTTPELTAPELEPESQPGTEIETQAPATMETGPEIMEPEPEAMEAEATDPVVVEPEAQEPEAQAPEAITPAASAPQITEPEASEPEASEPAAAEPQVSEAEEAGPGTIEPETAEPETEPGAIEPETAEPETGDPGVQLGPYWVQLGSYRQVTQIRAGWVTLNRRHGPALEEVEPYAQHHDGGERGMFWRLLTSPTEDRAIAQGDCELLLYAGMECFVIRTTGNIKPLSDDLEE